MTSKERAAMQQALEALEKTGIEGTGEMHDAAITALREALANTRINVRSTSEYSEQPVSQEPVSYVGQLDDEVIQHLKDKGYDHSTPLYAAPQPDINLNCKSVQKRLATQWGYVLPVNGVELTDDEIKQVWIATINSGVVTVSNSFARAVIAAYKEKNRG